VDGAYHATRAGAEVRVYAGGTDALLGVRVIDAGSGYDAQSDQPVHLGLGGSGKVDIEVIWPARGTRTRWRKNGVKLDGRKVVEVRTGTP
jgi:ASPIC and UnbV